MEDIENNIWEFEQPNEWCNKKTVQHGDIGEDICLNFLEQQGYCIYNPYKKDKPHPVDFFAAKNKQQIKIFEIKTKARMNKYLATGFDVNDLNDYLRLQEQHNMPVTIFFVDEHPSEKRIYCQTLEKLMQPKTINNVTYPNYDICKGVVLFHLSDMYHVKYLNENEFTSLTGCTTRNYEYTTTSPIRYA